MSENGGNAQYLPGVDNQALELEGLKKGIVYDRGTMHYFFYKSPNVVGYDEGVPTQWIRAELSSGTYHGHPMNVKRLSKYITVP
jgi:hypothetical protein